MYIDTYVHTYMLLVLFLWSFIIPRLVETFNGMHHMIFKCHVSYVKTNDLLKVSEMRPY